MVLILIIIILLVAFIITVAHELGHLAAAKLLKIKVDNFSIGKGKAVLTRQVSDTEYTLKAIPIGGYIKIDREYFALQSKKSRSIVLASGVLVNLIMAFSLFTIAGMIGVTNELGIRQGDTFGLASVAAVEKMGDAISILPSVLMKREAANKDKNTWQSLSALAVEFTGIDWVVLNLGLLATFSTLLSIMNLLPLPKFDGGHLFFIVLEAIAGEKLTEAEMYFHVLGGKLLSWGVWLWLIYKWW